MTAEVDNKYITPGVQSSIVLEEVPGFVRANWGIQIDNVREMPSQTGRVFILGGLAAKEAVDSPFGDIARETGVARRGRYALKVLPDSVKPKQLYLAYELSGVLNAVGIRIAGAEKPIEVQRYLPMTAPSNADGQYEVIAWHHNRIQPVRNPAILARFIPGERLQGDASLAAINYLAELHAKVHSHFRDPALLRLAENDDSLKIRCVKDYMDRFTRQDPEIIAQMPAVWSAILDIVDAAFPSLPQGVVPSSLWMGDVMFQDEFPTGLVDINETEYTSPLVCLGMSLWGLYVAKGGDIEPILQYVTTYQQHRELSPAEKELWPYFMLARAIMCWQGEKLVEHIVPGNKTSAQYDEDGVIKLFADFRRLRLVHL